MISISRFVIAAIFVASAMTPLVSSAQYIVDTPRGGANGDTVFTGSGPVNTSNGGSASVNGTSYSGGGSSGPGIDSSACSALRTGGFKGVVDCIIVYFNYFIYLLTALTVIYTVIGAFNMIGSEEKREDGKTAVYYGIIGLFVMVSIWGLVNVLDSTFRLSGTSPITPRPIERAF